MGCFQCGKKTLTGSNYCGKHQPTTGSQSQVFRRTFDDISELTSVADRDTDDNSTSQNPSTDDE